MARIVAHLTVMDDTWNIMLNISWDGLVKSKNTAYKSNNQVFDLEFPFKLMQTSTYPEVQGY